jgi:hypothetical protein
MMNFECWILDCWLPTGDGGVPVGDGGVPVGDGGLKTILDVGCWMLDWQMKNHFNES